jgi:deazaflavin-dependent oxidoreductase (nitroreductase family)
MPLRYVDPLKKRGPVKGAFVRFGRTPAGQWYARNVAARVDPWLYNVTGGRLTAELGTIMTAPLMTTGAKSGRPREIQITYLHDGPDPIAIASNYGGSKNPQWYHNLIAHPECQLGGENFIATEITDPTEYARVYGLAEKLYAGWTDYKAKVAPYGRHIPVFRLTPRDP